MHDYLVLADLIQMFCGLKRSLKSQIKMKKKMFQNLFKNYDDTVCEITLQNV